MPEERLNSDLSENGFESDTSLFGSTPDFTIEDLKASAFDSRFSHPNTVPVRLDKDEMVQVAVTLLRTIFAIDETADYYRDKDTVYFEYPDWYFEGWIVEEGSSYSDQKRRVRVYVYSNGSPSLDILLDEVIAQIIPASPHN
ncbi:hypothetical protein [Streptomyces sp. NBC_01439]|uniref:hypothetical protein n=1 Tax=Streptomyces sp. NBC_01439 TaxID=2903867 RepID=UPI002E29DBF2|nr:hypothetical protein [Streptomyces sp. NBC_01439]